MCKILFFDTDVTLSNFNHPEDSNRLVRLNYKLFNINQTLIKSNNFIIRPDGFIINNESATLLNITNQQAIKDGVSIETAIGDFLCTAVQADYIIAHNFETKSKLLFFEAVQADFKYPFTEIFKHRNHICTMQTTIDFIKNPFGNFTIADLHAYLFKFSFTNHTSSDNINLLSNCFFELHKQDFYTIEVFA